MSKTICKTNIISNRKTAKWRCKKMRVLIELAIITNNNIFRTCNSYVKWDNRLI